MWVGERHVEEEGLVVRAGQEAEGLFGVSRGKERAVGVGLEALCIANERQRLHVIAVRDAVESVEAAIGGKIVRGAPEVPLSDGLGAESALSEYVGEGGFLERQAGFLVRAECTPDPASLAVAAGEQSRSRGRAERMTGVKVREPESSGRHCVEVRGGKAGAVAAQIAIPEVVADHQDDVAGGVCLSMELWELWMAGRRIPMQLGRRAERWLLPSMREKIGD